MIPDCGVSGKAVLDDDGFRRFPGVLEVVGFVVNGLSGGMRIVGTAAVMAIR